MDCHISTNACTTISNRLINIHMLSYLYRMNAATLNLFYLFLFCFFILTFTTTMYSINICPCWQITKFPSDQKLHLDSGSFSWISKQCRVVGDTTTWSLFPCSWVSSSGSSHHLPCLLHTPLLLSDGGMRPKIALSSWCAPSPIWNPQHPKRPPPAKTGTSTCGW